MSKKRKISFIVTWIAVLLLLCSFAEASMYHICLNDLDFGIDEQTGGIVSLSYPATGMIITAGPQSGGLLDIAYPIETLPTMRLATCFSKARLIKDANELTIAWDQLGPSHNNIALPDGKVRAEVKLRSAPDGKSVIMTCKIENLSGMAIPQVIFPDLRGIQPFNGTEQTQIWVAGKVAIPFAEPVRKLGDPTFYVDLGLTQYAIPQNNPNALRRITIAGTNSGLTVFKKDSGKGNLNRFFTHRKESSPTSLRLMWEHKNTIEHGQMWESGEFWIIPYKDTWTNSVTGVRKITLNGLEIWLNEENGNIVYLLHPSVGAILESIPEYAGLLDAFYVADGNEIRLSSDFSKARFEEVAGGLNIIWDHLNPAVAGNSFGKANVRAQVNLKASADGKSVMMSCQIENDANLQNLQVQFPRLCGLNPFDGIDNTQLRLGGGVVHPFAEKPQPHEYTDESFHYNAFNLFFNSLRWLDYGSLKGGLSVFQKKWGGDRPDILTQRNDENPMKLSLVWKNEKEIIPCRKWKSGEFCFTPHRGGWAKGIEVYRDYVAQVNPPRSLPDHVRDGIGYQTIWMQQSLDPDPQNAAFRFTDLPRIAQDCAEHGINELSLWGWCNYGQMPITLRTQLGTEQEFLEGIRKAKQFGVNVAPYVGIHIILRKYVQRYCQDEKLDIRDWTYDTECIPNMQPYYLKLSEGAWIKSNNKIWQDDVITSLKEWIDKGVSSFGFDTFQEDPEFIELAKKIRTMASAKDPQAVFSGETVLGRGTEQVGSVLDYTWNWNNGYFETTPVLNVMRTPRLNIGIDDSPLILKKAFCDGMYLNVRPRKLDKPNGTALISEKPEISAALKEVAHLRRQFLNYFVKGHVLGNSVLSAPASVFVCGHQLPGKLLIIILNDQNQPCEVSLQSNLDLWLPVVNSYEVKYYNSQGNLLQTIVWKKGVNWVGKSQLLQPLELAFFEIETK
jgi:hypothetical protein